MNQFRRRLDHLDRLPASHIPAWFGDLLRLWQPSGTDAGEFGLRLAVRDNYLNFYRKGQSVARVHVGADGLPYARVHHKYVEAPAGAGGAQEYFELRGTSVKGKNWSGEYRNIETLMRWVKVAEEKHSGAEKRIVDAIVAANPGVIDLEMGMPDWCDQGYAPRMDLVMLERGSAGMRVVLWEVKLVNDPRIRCRPPVVPREKPEVLRQLDDYVRFLKEERYRALVADAYRQTLRVLQELARRAGRESDLPPIWLQAGSSLIVEPEPRLAVVIDRSLSETGKAAWAEHEQNLGKHVPLKVLDLSKQQALHLLP